MKSPKHAGKAAKPRIMYAAHPELADIFVVTEDTKNLASTAKPSPLLVLPQSSLSAAKKRLKWERMTGEQKVEAVAKEIAKLLLTGLPWRDVWEDVKERYRVYARSILTLISP